ncbi:glutamine amidotransferase-related protein [Salinicola rhizosphaerae]|uniref:CTP synthase (glutamine hydrolyzing) n=1 Tax=Salinicola rhizosphaerae TaxID=1443141 RepID=A0ABQ3DV77_9GAMM|nr:gamma-glutamyl-gamma-aminobutyrate hydrolase family protein [Salinicola rhizosphaerae]GHB14570.1 hypothetical protein GCM10009038_11230 [Salinicola rhizosphaerae]
MRAIVFRASPAPDADPTPAESALALTLRGVALFAERYTKGACRIVLPWRALADDASPAPWYQHISADGQRLHNHVTALERARLDYAIGSAGESAVGSGDSLTLHAERVSDELGERRSIAVEPTATGLRLRAGDWHATAALDPFVRDRWPETSRPEPATPSRPYRLSIAGEVEHLQEIYPAVLAAIGDAADAIGLNIALRIVSPRELTLAKAESLVAESDGLLLPGGCDNSQIDGQILLAAAALARDLPTLGLCFGMQSMATALIRQRLGVTGAHLEEVNPAATTLAISRLSSMQPRLGDRRVDLLEGSRAADAYGATRAVERMNHRFGLDAHWWEPLRRAGVIVSGRGRDAPHIADILEVKDRRFYLGVQGHPELRSRPDLPHPALVAWLRALSSTSN